MNKSKFARGKKWILSGVGAGFLLSVISGWTGIFAAAMLLFMSYWLLVGFKLPIRPFFIVSSLIVFYLCIKFMGLGIHSLQLAGMLPVSNSTTLPSINLLALYPSWQSAAPQLLVALFAIVFLIINRIRKKKAKTQIVIP